MAVVSISKIQVRRGKKNSDEGLPQLASGEFGWAIDTQELYIGNGSVAEGAPAVGNTRLLSSNDNLFELATNYSYLQGAIQTGRSSNSPVKRSLQDRLDDRVSIRAFGSETDGDHSTVLQRALDQLYLLDKDSRDKRVVLYIEPGRYTLHRTVYVPPFATIIGAGVDRTVFETVSDFTAFETTSSNSSPVEEEVPGNYVNDGTVSYETQARHIHMSGFTVLGETSRGICVNNCRDSVFEEIALRKKTGHPISTDDWGIYFKSLGTSVASRNNEFRRVLIKGHGHCVKSDYNIYNNTWLNCSFIDAVIAVLLGAEEPESTAQEAGSVASVFHQCRFDRIEQEGILIERGAYNKSSHNRYYNVGNNLGTPSNTPGDIEFPNFSSSSVTDTSINDWFERQELLSSDPDFISIGYSTEISSPSFVNFNQTHSVDIDFSPSDSVLCKLPAGDKQGFEIEYLYTSDQSKVSRTGVLEIVSNTPENKLGFSDEYTFTGSSPGDLDLFAEYTADRRTIEVKYINLTSGDAGRLQYRVKAKSTI